MDNLRSFADERLLQGGCAYCGGEPDTRDHVPSKAFLDDPFPTHLPVVGACRKCNESFASDEEYLACLIECVRVGSAEPSKVERPSIRRTLEKQPNLAARLARAHNKAKEMFQVENGRARNVLLKLARGHSVFELDTPQFGEPDHFMFTPLTCVDKPTVEAFESPPASGDSPLWPEVGSRAMQRMVIATDGIGASILKPGWMVVQEGRYRYLTSNEEAITVRIVISEFLACEVIWGL